MKHLDNNELGDRLYLVINFIFIYLFQLYKKYRF